METNVDFQKITKLYNGLSFIDHEKLIFEKLLF
jgi:hypothetical protein